MASRSPRRVALDVNAIIIIIMKKELGYSRLVRVVPMILKDLIPCAFEISPWLPRRVRVPFIPISNKPGLVLHAVSPSFATVNDIQHIPFFVRFVVARVCYHDRGLGIWVLAGVRVFWGEVELPRVEDRANASCDHVVR